MALSDDRNDTRNDLRKEIATPRAALAPFAAFGEVYFKINPHNDHFYGIQTGHPTEEREINRVEFQAASKALGNDFPPLRRRK